MLHNVFETDNITPGYKRKGAAKEKSPNASTFYTHTQSRHRAKRRPGPKDEHNNIKSYHPPVITRALARRKSLY